jgi:hypothetical protein
MMRFTLHGLKRDRQYRVRLDVRTMRGWKRTRFRRFRSAIRAVAARRRSRAKPHRSGRLLWGGQIGDQFTGAEAPWDMNAVADFGAMVGKAPSIVPFNLPFEGCSTSCNYYAFPTAQMNAVRAYGSLVMLNWSSMSSPLSATEPAFTLAKVADGTYDSYIRRFALAAKRWGHPFLLRFDWEMDGDWFPWAVGANTNKVSDFVAAWRHVHDIFTSVGATNATWVWCPSVDNYHKYANLAALYPGRAYVDWTGLDGYNFGDLHGPGGWRSFRRVFSGTYKTIREIAPHKPMIIAETASAETGGDKAVWITNMFHQIQTKFRNIHALVYYDQYQDTDGWPVETSTAALNAFKAGIASPRYASNAYRNDTLSKVTAR